MTTDAKQTDALRESRDWWREEAEHQRREAERVWFVLLGTLPLVAFFCYWLGVLTA